MTPVELDEVAALLPTSNAAPLDARQIASLTTAGLLAVAGFHADAAEAAERKAKAFLTLLNLLAPDIRPGDDSLAMPLARLAARSGPLSRDGASIGRHRQALALVQAYPDFLGGTS